ncbi:M20/M25/M40 family metallo-hydrolase [Roseococcus sp. DSY-14]|uniref:M20/M25/M40 family metallo-hydrolase n=1 Tax=Roseococcus sp. DSY-14 TaxID=3369650 RepID=UPI00387B1793
MEERIRAIRQDARFAAACAVMAQEHDRTVDDIIRLTEIPAPPFGEGPRAAAYLEMLRAHGLEDCAEDAVGNVMGTRRGFGNGEVLVVAAHLDTVFPAGTDVRVRREGTKLFAPGVGDDTRSLAVNLAFLRAMDQAGIRTRADILFLGDVGEEGLGDLRGVRHFFAQHPRRHQVTGFLTVDSPEVERIVTGGIGSKRYRVTFRGPGGHSFAAFGLVNPVYALADAARAVAAIRAPREPVTTHCVSVVGGGTSINAIPEMATMEVDLRSASAEVLARIEGEFLRAVDAAVAAENAARSGGLAVEVVPVGDRPAGHTPNGSAFARLAQAAVASEGYQPSFEWSSTDANVPMALGVPALRIGSGGKGGRAHSLEEWIDVEETESLRGMRASLLTILAAAGMEAG